MKEVKEYGLHRSGTNFLRVILQENYEVTVLTNIGGWKHGRFRLPEALGREVTCAFCVKNPYAWARSIYNHLHPEKDVPFPDFVRRPLRLESPDGPEWAISGPNPLRLWVDMYQHWLGVELKTERKFLYRYEEVLADPFGSIAELVQHVGLERRQTLKNKLARAVGMAVDEPEFFLPSIRLGAVPENYKGKHIKRGEAFNASQYTNREYLSAYTPELLAFANEQLDPALLARLGYDLVRELG